MKDGFVIKSSPDYILEQRDLDLINNYTRRKLSKDEVYIFSVVLCDNEVDREFEKFSNDALEQLAPMFIGKTGILNHDAKSENQMARIFACEVEKVPGKVNSVGEPYFRLVARAYMPRCEKNNDFILEIDSGIKKEVSVGCAVKNMTCSICGCDIKSEPCTHRKGEIYNDSLCYVILSEPLDAYEWSFVAVPAQKNAGVIKMFHYSSKGGANCMNDIIKSIKNGEAVNISAEQARDLSKLICELERLANEGKEYFNDLKREVIRLCALTQPEINSEVMDNVASKMSLSELKAFKKAFELKSEEILPAKPQLSALKKETVLRKNNDFKM